MNYVESLIEAMTGLGKKKIQEGQMKGVPKHDGSGKWVNF